MKMPWFVRGDIDGFFGLFIYGVIHAYDLTAAGVQNKFGWLAAPQFVAGYGLTALVLIGLHFHRAGEARTGRSSE